MEGGRWGGGKCDTPDCFTDSGTMLQIFLGMYDAMSPRGQRVEPDISISIHGSAPGYFPHFQNP